MMKLPTVLLIFRASDETHWVHDQKKHEFHKWFYSRGQQIKVHVAVTHVGGFLNGLTQVTIRHSPCDSSTALIPTEHISIVRMYATLSTGKAES
jgi:hypothetical protein